jgi:DNA-binding HxlR family transcriptional regulator
MDAGDIAAAATAAVTAPAGPAVPTPVAAPAGPCRASEVLARVGDKWSLQVIFCLSNGTQRFTDLKRGIAGISQRMLTVTLRGLERDGIISRTVYPVVPPRVDYALTPMGCTLIDAVGAIMSWTHAHLDEIDAARAAYDAREQASRQPLTA